MPLNVQPFTCVSATVYVTPGVTLYVTEFGGPPGAVSSSSVMVGGKPDPVAVNWKSWAWFGCATFVMVSDACFVLVNVQSTLAPGEFRVTLIPVAEYT